MLYILFIIERSLQLVKNRTYEKTTRTKGIQATLEKGF